MSIVVREWGCHICEYSGQGMGGHIHEYSGQGMGLSHL